jgi:hypothetical protein
LNRYDVVLVSFRAFNWRDLKSKDVILLSSTLNMEGKAALLTKDTGAASIVASHTGLVISCSWDGRYSFRGHQRFCVAESDLRSPYGTSYVYPVVVGCPLQGFTRVNRSVQLFLLFAIKFCCFASLLDF